MRFVLVLVVVASLPLAAQSPLPPVATAPVDYEKDVKPLLAQHCYSCHGDAAQQAGLRLDLRQNALRGGDYGPVIIPGRSAESKLIRRLVDGDGGLQMPPSGPLSDDEIGVLRAWIDQGAEFRTEIAERPSRPVDPRFAGIAEAVRLHDVTAVERAIARDPAAVHLTDAAGNTLLHHAAGFGSLTIAERLIEAGVDVNARNKFGSTALHWSAHDASKVALLLARGASVDSRQVEGRTPLFLAASMATAHDSVRRLLQEGADPNRATASGQTPLMAAALRGDLDLMRQLLVAKAEVNAKNGAGETALMFAAATGSPQAVALLLERGADARVRSKRSETALGNAATAGNEETVRLLDAGAEVNVRNIRGFSPLMLAANSDAIPAGVVRLLLARGADPSYTADYDESARDLAAKRGDTDVARLLGAAPRPHTSAVSLQPVHGSASAALRPAVSRALASLEKQSHTFIRISGCNSCHSQDLPAAAAALARSRGIPAPGQIPRLPHSMTLPPERLMDLSIVALMGPLWEVFGMGMTGEKRTAYTDAAVRLIRTSQRSDGSWSAAESRRPPMASGEFMATALGVYALTQYGLPPDRPLIKAALERAAAWLTHSTPRDVQDGVFQALGLHWIAPQSSTARAAARRLARLQRPDGGWSQLPTLESDAYATGQALYALAVTGGMSTNAPAFRRGMEYLLRTQAGDGTWHVKSRAIWLQPYFESGFPYGQDQFISAAGTAWAAMALAAAAEPPRATARR